MIDGRELLEKARKTGLNLRIVEKDYVLGWMLYGMSKDSGLVFKGGTALSKVYFPKHWRLSEDLDFSLVKGGLKERLENIGSVLAGTQRKSGIEFVLASNHINPYYLQLKIRYKGVLDRNWIKVDVTMNDLVDEPETKAIRREYSDYVPFKVRVESLAEIFASKLRSILERKKCRDFYDLWKLAKINFDKVKIKEIFANKCAIKGIEFHGLRHVFSSGLAETLKPYWEREIGRLIHPAPDMATVLADIHKALDFLE